MQEFSFNKDTSFKEQFNVEITHFSLVTYLLEHREEITALQWFSKGFVQPLLLQ